MEDDECADIRTCVEQLLNGVPITPCCQLEKLTPTKISNQLRESMCSKVTSTREQFERITKLYGKIISNLEKYNKQDPEKKDKKLLDEVAKIKSKTANVKLDVSKFKQQITLGRCLLDEIVNKLNESGQSENKNDKGSDDLKQKLKEEMKIHEGYLNANILFANKMMQLFEAIDMDYKNVDINEKVKYEDIENFEQYVKNDRCNIKICDIVDELEKLKTAKGVLKEKFEKAEELEGEITASEEKTKEGGEQTPTPAPAPTTLPTTPAPAPTTLPTTPAPAPTSTPALAPVSATSSGQKGGDDGKDTKDDEFLNNLKTYYDNLLKYVDQPGNSIPPSSEEPAGFTHLNEVCTENDTDDDCINKLFGTHDKKEKDEKFSIKKISDDGNCFFYAVAQAIAGETGDNKSDPTNKNAENVYTISGEEIKYNETAKNLTAAQMRINLADAMTIEEKEKYLKAEFEKKDVNVIKSFIDNDKLKQKYEPVIKYLKNGTDGLNKQELKNEAFDYLIKNQHVFANDQVYPIIEQLYNVRLMIFTDKEQPQTQTQTQTQKNIKYDYIIHIYTKKPSKYILLFHSGGNHFDLIRQGTDKVSFQISDLVKIPNLKKIFLDDTKYYINSKVYWANNSIKSNDLNVQVNVDNLTKIVNNVGVLLDELIEYYGNNINSPIPNTSANGSSQKGLPPQAPSEAADAAKTAAASQAAKTAASLTPTNSPPIKP